MKVKIKITLDQFATLIRFLKSNTYESLNDLQILNIKLFLPIGLKKLIDCNLNYSYNPPNVKSFSIEINQYTAIMSLLMNERNNLEPYLLATLINLQQQNKNLLQLSI